jgi:predicted transcriptional regulator
VKAIQSIHNLVEKNAPGRPPEFTSAHVLISLKMISKTKIGRKQLAEDLGLGEGTTRNLIRRLTNDGLITSDRQGMKLTKKGSILLSEITEKVIGATFTGTDITVACHNFFVLVRGAESSIKYGVEQRDSALLAGAKGATTLIFKNGELMMPGMQKSLDETEIEQIMKLGPREGDVIIIGTADSPLYAKTGAYSAALDLV